MRMKTIHNSLPITTKFTAGPSCQTATWPVPSLPPAPRLPDGITVPP